jgi:hypothetical protein
MEQTKQARAAQLARLIERLRSGMRVLEGLDRRFFLVRLVVLISGTGATLLAFGLAPEPWGWLVLSGSVLVFSGVVFFHRRIDRRQREYQLFQQWAETQVARMRLDWTRIPPAQDLGIDKSHPFALDLDLVGERSLHQLIDTATSRGGSRRLADWLLYPVLERGRIEGRQQLLREMQPLNGFRTGLALRGMQVKAEAEGQWDADTLLRWLDQADAPRSLVPVLALLFLLGACNLVLYLLFAFQGIPAYFLISLVAYSAIYLYKYREYSALFEDAYSISKALEGLRKILLYLETYPYPAGGALGNLAQPFTRPGRQPSGYIRKIVGITSAASLNGNPFLALLINTLVPWNLLFAQLLNEVKAQLRKDLPPWLDTWYELEACLSLANFAALNPRTTFPRILDQEEPLFQARGLGHSLIQEEGKVRNDFSIRHLGEVAILTGSNMSGKSTFLRTLGVNLCLAFAGGPVDADALEPRLFRLFTCIQVSDSLSNGMSYFYSEVRRLKQLLDGLEPREPLPQFYLIDEIFRGTNNRERQIGSQAYVHALAKGHGAGAISTHDLELARLGDGGTNIFNYHFREDIQGQRMVFDYKLRLGASPTTNALKIMALEGLPVGQETPETPGSDGGSQVK